MVVTCGFPRLDEGDVDKMTLVSDFCGDYKVGRSPHPGRIVILEGQSLPTEFGS